MSRHTPIPGAYRESQAIVHRAEASESALWSDKAATSGATDFSKATCASVGSRRRRSGT